MARGLITYDPGCVRAVGVDVELIETQSTECAAQIVGECFEQLAGPGEQVEQAGDPSLRGFEVDGGGPVESLFDLVAFEIGLGQTRGEFLTGPFGLPEEVKVLVFKAVEAGQFGPQALAECFGSRLVGGDRGGQVPFELCDVTAPSATTRVHLVQLRGKCSDDIEVERHLLLLDPLPGAREFFCKGAQVVRTAVGQQVPSFGFPHCAFLR